jgi:hypothetical protein
MKLVIVAGVAGGASAGGLRAGSYLSARSGEPRPGEACLIEGPSRYRLESASARPGA